MGQIQVFPLGAVGNLGQNTQSNPVDLAPVFVTEVKNAVFDEGGRIAARKSLMLTTEDDGELGATNALERVFRHNHIDGTSTYISAGYGEVFTGIDTIASFYTASDTDKNRWQFASLNGYLYMAQSGEDFKEVDETDFTTLATISTPAGVAGANCVHSAFGRLWAANGGNDYILYWSVLQDGADFAGVGSGSLDMSTIFVNGKDSIVAVSSHNKNIIVFCRNSIYVFGLAADLDPGNSTTPIYLITAVNHIGCVARDSVVSTADDIFFLSDDGVRSLRRALENSGEQMKLTDVTKLNNALIKTKIRNSTAADITAAYWPNEGWYLLFLPDFNEVWVFDTGRQVQDTQTPALLVWNVVNRPVYHAAYWTDDELYFAGVGGVYDYQAYDSTDDYDLVLTTGWLSMQDPSALKHLKKMLLNLNGGASSTGVLKWNVDFDTSKNFSRTFTFGDSAVTYEYGTAEYGLAEYGIATAIEDIYIQIGNSAKFVRFTLTIPIDGKQVSINNAQLYMTKGRIR